MHRFSFVSPGRVAAGKAKAILCPHGILGKKKCKQCATEVAHKRYLADPDRYKGYAKKRRTEKRDHHNKLKREWYAKNRDKALEWQKRYREANREKLREFNRQYGIIHREKHADRLRKRRREREGMINAPAEKKYGKCPLCPWVGELVPDHDHDNGLLRDWICWRCNISLGHFNEDNLRVFLDYLTHWKKQHVRCQFTTESDRTSPK